MWSHSGAQSAHVFDECATRWFAYANSSEDVQVFWHDVDHIGRRASSDATVLHHVSADRYSAFSFYHPFLGRIGSCDKRLAERLGVAPCAVPNEIGRRDRICYVPSGLAQASTIAAANTQHHAEAVARQWTAAVLADVERSAVDAGQMARVARLASALPRGGGSLLELYQSQFNVVGALLGKRSPTIRPLSSYLMHHTERLTTHVARTWSPDYSELLTVEVGRLGLPYSPTKNGGEIPFSAVDSRTLRRRPLSLSSLAKMRSTEFLVPRHAFLLGCFSVSENSTTRAMLCGERVAYHQLLPLAERWLGLPDDSVLVEYQQSPFFRLIADLPFPVRVPGWLRTYLDAEIVPLSVLVRGISTLGTLAEELLDRVAGMASDEAGELLAQIGRSRSLGTLLDLRKGMAAAPAPPRDSRTDSASDSSLGWYELVHLGALARFKHRGAHLIWLYVLAGEEAARHCIEELAREEVSNAV